MNGHRLTTVMAFGALAVVSLACSVGLAGVLNVDIGNSGQQTLPGYETLTISQYASVPIAETYTSDLGSAGQVTVVLDDYSTIIGLSGLGEVNHAMSNLLEECAYIDGYLTITLQNLAAGEYYLMSYHHDRNVVRGDLRISTSDAVASSVTRYDQLVATTGSTPGSVATAPMIIQANGTDDVVIRYTPISTAGNLRAIINGFQLTDTLPTDLKVDIGVDLAGNDVQDGFQSFAITNDTGSATGSVSAPQSNWYFSEIGNQGSVEVTLSDAASTPKIGVRDRGDASGLLADLVEDSVYNATSRELTLTLGSLKPGAYSITTWHNDKDNNHGELNISVSDALGVDQLCATGLAQSQTSDSMSVICPTCSFVSNGIDPVVLTFESPSPSDPYVMLNGFAAIAKEALRVDFGQEPGAGRDDVQNGFESFNAGNSDSEMADGVYRDYASSLGTAGTVRVTVNSDDHTLLVRDRGDLVGSLGDVGEDFIFDGSPLELVLSDLKAGRYAMTTYHHDINQEHATFDIFVTDASDTLRLVADDVTHTTGSLGDPASTTFELFANGTDDVMIRFARISATDGVALNGFSISLVPEPGTFLLAVLGIFFLPLLGRRRRSR